MDLLIKKILYVVQDMRQNLSGHVRNIMCQENNRLLIFDSYSVETVKSVQRYKLSG